jgi:hypothetical protein
MELTIFYAWQNDIPNQVNRFLIRDVVKSVSKSIRNDASVEDSPRIDHDTLDVPGTPEITSTIFSKIRRCAVFVADVTFVGTKLSMASSSEDKPLPNPNVMLELGFAAATVGWERIITVMNEHYGPAEQQIFDIKSRRFPIRYTLNPDAPAGLDETKQRLRSSIEQAIRLALRSEYAAVEDIIESLDGQSLSILRETAKYNQFWRSEESGLFYKAAADAAYRHLLALRLIRATWDHPLQNYVYEWTYLGLQTLIRLGLRSQP